MSSIETTDYGDLPLAFRMKVDTAHCSLDLVETDVVKPFEASS